MSSVPNNDDIVRTEVSANSYLAHVGTREHQVDARMKIDRDPPPDLTRSEYLRLLSVALLSNRKRTYFLIEIFANTNLSVQDVRKLTVEAVRAGKVNASIGRMIQPVYIPSSIQSELISYIERKGLTTGSVLLTRNGTPMSRTSISQSIGYLSSYANVDEKKCNPRCLKRLYQSTRESLERNITMPTEQAHNRLLEEEQLQIGWA